MQEEDDFKGNESISRCEDPLRLPASRSEFLAPTTCEHDHVNAVARHEPARNPATNVSWTTLDATHCCKPNQAISQPREERQLPHTRASPSTGSRKHNNIVRGQPKFRHPLSGPAKQLVTQRSSSASTLVEFFGAESRLRAARRSACRIVWS